MALDPYQVCPCGSNKKVKFCCCKDMVGDLETLLRTIEGNQPTAALDQAGKLIAAKGPRLALLSLKASLELTTGDTEDAVKTIAEFSKAAPHNPVALALTAVVAAMSGDVKNAVEKLQRALEYLDEAVPFGVFNAIGIVAEALLESGDVLAARGHWLLQARLAGERESDAVLLLLRLNRARDIPLPLKEQLPLLPCPLHAPWQGEFEAAMRSALRGAWFAATESLMSLAEKVPAQAAIMRNIAVLRGWLGQTKQASVAWHQYATLPGLPLDEAVEAESLSIILDEFVSSANTADELTVTYQVRDTDRLMERLLSDRRASRIPIDVREFAEENQPPPRGAFYLLDRPVPEASADISPDAIPAVLGQMYVFGRETDREARLEFSVTRLPDIEQRKAMLAEVGGDCLGDQHKEEVTGKVPFETAMLTRLWRVPEGLPRERRQSILIEKRRATHMDQWPSLPRRELDGKTPREATADPVYHTRILAAILLLELAAESRGEIFDFNELRQSLGLPTRGAINPEGINVRDLSLARLAQLDARQLTDQQLLDAYQAAWVHNVRAALYAFAKEVIEREKLPPEVEKAEIYESLISASPDPDTAITHLERARQYSEAKGQSPVHWWLSELSLRIGLGDFPACNQILRTIQSKHLREPGVAQALQNLLASHGLVPVAGRPGQEAEAIPEAAAAAATGPAEPGKIWTPGSSNVGPPSGAPSKLWIPGNE